MGSMSRVLAVREGSGSRRVGDRQPPDDGRRHHGWEGEDRAVRAQRDQAGDGPRHRARCRVGHEVDAGGASRHGDAAHEDC